MGPRRNSLRYLNRFLSVREAASLLSSRLDPEETKEILLFLTDKKYHELFFSGAKIPFREITRFIRGRKKGIPLAYLTGEKVFMGFRFRVDPSVLIPRPETELLAEKALLLAREKNLTDLLDIGTGSGCIALSLAASFPQLRITATDISGKALRTAKKNLKAFPSLTGRVRFIRADLFPPKSYGSFDMIVSNPPYVPDKEWKDLDPEVRREPGIALLAGPRGMDSIERIARKAPSRLKKGAYFLLEIGYNQKNRAEAVLKKNGFKIEEILRDFKGISRIMVSRWPD